MHMGKKYHPLGSTASNLQSRARTLTGVFDVVDSLIEEPLERLVASLNTEAKLTSDGAEAMEQRLLRLLCNRLRMRRDFDAHPEINDQKIIGPVFLTGGPRTGSTKLHKLLAAGGDFKFLTFWQGHCLALRSGDRDEDCVERLAEAAEYIRWISDHAPRAQSNHAYGLLEPEEEALILEHFICGTFLGVFAHVPTFIEWCAIQDFREQAAFLRQGLKYLQWQFHPNDSRPWLLKCPIYWGFEGVLKDIFPDVVFVTTNRDPIQTVASAANLVSGYREAYSDEDWRKVLGPTYLEALSKGICRHMSLRDRRADLEFMDVGYSELMQSPDNVIKRLYEHSGMELSENALQAMRVWDETHRHSALAGQGYSLADYSLTEADIRTEFSEYSNRFRQLL